MIYTTSDSLIYSIYVFTFFTYHLYFYCFFSLSHLILFFFLFIIILFIFFFFFFNDPAPPEISPLPLHDALPISRRPPRGQQRSAGAGLAILAPPRGHVPSGTHLPLLRHSAGRALRRRSDQSRAKRARCTGRPR